jgi:miniconductance mechanosensitive channel
MVWHDVVGFFADRPLLNEIVTLLGLLVIGGVVHLLVRRYVLALLYRIFCQTRMTWDEICFEQGVFDNLPYLVPALIINQGAALLPTVGHGLEKITSIWIVVIFGMFLGKFLSALFSLYASSHQSTRRPVKGYVETIKLVIYLGVGVIAISMLLDKSPIAFISGLGAVTAVLMLIFRDTILSFVASVRIISNDLVREGDWIEMPKYEADGNVIEAGLHTIKVQNWDKTISSIPTYKLVEDPFRNWRGMAESGGRRIKRAILIDQSSICFCDEEMLARYERIQLIQDYIRERKREIVAFNQKHHVDSSHIVNGRRMTNVGTFRAYVTAYLRNHPRIRQDMTFLVRQLQPTPEGLPLEIYVFVNDVVWAHYETVQADIFDHILAAAPHFDLRIFQNPTGFDLHPLVLGKYNGESDGN